MFARTIEAEIEKELDALLGKAGASAKKAAAKKKSTHDDRSVAPSMTVGAVPVGPGR